MIKCGSRQDTKVKLAFTLRFKELKFSLPNQLRRAHYNKMLAFHEEIWKI